VSVIEALILGIVQGLTEFIPVSSSGHLVLFEKFFMIGNGSLAFDVALHGGTLLALVIFFWRDILLLIKSLIIKSDYTNLTWMLIVASVPAVFSGLLLEQYVEDTFRSSLLVSINLIVVAIIMLLAESIYKKSIKHTDLKKTNKKQALIMGFAQATAVIPGVSRSGSTITAGLFANLDRLSATRFSFLLGIPIIFGAFAKTVFFGDNFSQIKQEYTVFSLGFITALVVGLLAIKFLLKYLSGHGLQIFAYYRIALGLIIIFATFL
jgi:undecaprenyl-diphosphatase